MNGKLNFTPEIIKKICHLFNISQSEFYNSISEIKTEPSNQRTDLIQIHISEKDWLEMQLLQKELEIVQLKLKLSKTKFTSQRKAYFH